MNIQKVQLASEEQRIVLKQLAETTSKPSCKFLEVGSWLGDSTVVLGKVAKENGGFLFCVDWWKGSAETELNELALHKDIFSLFWDKICAEGLDDVIVPIRTLSDVAFQVLKEDTFDFIFIDGDHRYKQVLKDIQNYAPLVAPKGILCGHDCEGRISDYDMRFLEAGKESDAYESVHCGVVLAVGSTFKHYSVNHGIWSVQAGVDNGSWKSTNLELLGILSNRQPPPPVIFCINDYNLTRYGNLVYAFSHLLREDEAQNIYLLKPEEEPLSEYLQTKKCFIGKSIEEVKMLIEDNGITLPKLLDSYQDYNLIRYKGCIYAAWQGLELDLTEIGISEIGKYQEKKQLFIANSIDAVKKDVELTGITMPVLQESYQNFNLVRYNDVVYAVWQGLEIDLTEIGISEIKEYQDEKRLFIGSSIDEAKDFINQLLSLPKVVVQDE